jgi:hypothetical protein
MRSPVLAQAGGFKPRLFFQTGIQYLLEDKFTSYRGIVADGVPFSVKDPAPNCDVPAFGKNVKGLVGAGTVVPGASGKNSAATATDTFGGYYPKFVVGDAATHYQNIEQDLPNLFRPDPNTPSLDHGYDQQRVVSVWQGKEKPATPPQLPTRPVPVVKLTRVAGSGGFAVGGSNCRSDFRAKTSIDLMWDFGVGVEFTIPVLSRQFHLRLSVDYKGQSFGETEATWSRESAFDVCTMAPKSGVVGHPGTSNSACMNTGNSLYSDPKPDIKLAPSNNLIQVEDYVLTVDRSNFKGPRFEARGTGAAFVTHAVGPTIQVDVDVFKRGDLRINLYLELGFAWLINDAGSTLTLKDVPDQIYNCTIDTNSPLCAYKRAGERPEVSFAVAPQSLISQGGGGIRILWSPPW